MFPGKMLRRLRLYLINEGLKMFTAILWFGVNTALFYFTFMYYYTGPQFYYLHQMLGYGLCISRASAACINLNCSALLLPMCKRLITTCRGLNHCVGRQIRRLLDRSRSFHIYCGYLLCLLTAIHCGAHAYNAIFFSKRFNSRYKDLNVAKYADQNPLLMLVTTVAGITGLMLVACVVLISVYASKPMRKNSHTRFWKTHHLFIAFYTLLFIHGFDGVIKYQTNIKEHRPGCFVPLGNSPLNVTGPIVLPEPEPHPHPEGNIEMPKKVAINEQKIINKIAIPEPEPMDVLLRPRAVNDFEADSLSRPLAVAEPDPMPEQGMMKKNDSLRVFVSGKWIDVAECKQPPPKFASCPKETWIWIGFPLLLYMLERTLRHFFATTTDAAIIGYKQHPGDVIELKIAKKSFKAKSGQSIWLRCPSVSKIESHPFTLTSVPSKSDPTFGIHIKVLGDWTSEFRDLVVDGDWNNYKPEKACFDTPSFPTNQPATKRCSRDDSFADYQLNIEPSKVSKPLDPEVASLYDNVSGSRLEDETRGAELDTKIEMTGNESTVEPNSLEIQHFPAIFVEGPTGSPMEDIYKYKVSVCFAGGIGITPFASILNTLLTDDAKMARMKLRRIHLIWACRDVASFDWFATLINQLHEKLSSSNNPDLLSVGLYLTNSAQEADVTEKATSLKRCKMAVGRPPIGELLQNTATCHPGTTIGVFCCGPPGLISSVRHHCFQTTSNCKAKFVFSKESF